MNGLIIYKSKFGSTREYAEWISEATGFEAISVNEVTSEDIEKSEVIIIGSPVMAGKYTISGWLKKHWGEIKGKAIAFYSVTATALERGDDIMKFWENSIPEEIREELKLFLFGGRKEFDKIGGGFRFMLKTVAKMQKDEKVKQEMLQDVNNMSKEFIIPLVDYIKAKE